MLSYVISDTTGGDRLFAREWREGKWAPDTLLARGAEWFVNWADYPSVQPLGGNLFYHLLEYAGEGTYDYDIRFAVGEAGGDGAQVLHNDGVSAEHGFLSSAHRPDGSLRVTWLDGRHTKTPEAPAEDGNHHHRADSGGAMTLRTAIISRDGRVGQREELDHRVCDCCNTATVVTDGGAMVVYRDRSEEEIRDMAFVRQLGDGSWTEPERVNPDNWQITGCPVNGPALTANARGDIATAWFTAADDKPRIQFARFDTLTQHFRIPLVLDADGSLGRVDAVMEADGTAYVLGLTQGREADTADLKLWTIDPDNRVSAQTVGRMSAGRSSGFPRLALGPGGVWVAYREPGPEQRVRLCFREH